MALGTLVAGAAAYSAVSGTSITPAYPTGIQTTDAVILFVGQKPTTANGGTVTTPSGWTLRESLTGAGGYGTATPAADTGNVNLFVYSWDSPVAGQTGNLTVTVGDNNVAWAFIVRIPSTRTAGTLLYGSADGQQTTTPTSPLSVALTNGTTATAFRTGDVAVWAMCIPTDVTTPAQFSAETITATGATFGTVTEINEPDSNTGNDIGGFSAWASVSSGSSSTAPTIGAAITGTLTNVRGPVVLLRVRESYVLTCDPQTYNETFNAANLNRGLRINAERLGTGIDSVSTTSVFSDDFNRANSTSLGSGWQLELNSFQISNNQVKGNTFDGRSIATVTAGGYVNNQYAQIDVAALNSNVNDFIGVGVRVAGLAGYYFSTDGYFQRRLSKKDSAGTITAIGTKDIYWSVGDILKLSAEGNIISVYRNGQLVERVIDSSYTSGKPAIEYNWANTNAAAGDNFTSGNLVDNTNLLAQRKLVCDTRSYALTGIAANLNHGNLLLADLSPYTLTRNDATLTYAPATSTYTLALATGTFTTTYNPANLLKIVLSAKNLILTGNPITLTPSRYLSLARPTFTLTGPPPSLIGIVDTHTVTINPPAGWALHLVTDISQAGSATCIYYNLSPAVAVGDQILYKTTTETNGRTVSVSSTGIVTTTPTGTDTLKFRHWRPSTWSAELTYTVVATSAYTLALATSTYTLTGNNINLLRGLKLVAKVYADEQLFSDDFTGTNGVLGTEYTQQGDVPLRRDGLGNANAVGAGRGLAWPNTVSFDDSHYAEITITAIETSSNNSGIGLRIQTSATPPIEYGYIFRTGNAGAEYTFAQYNVSSTNVNIITTNIIPQVGDRIRAAVIGNNQYFYVNNQLIAIGSTTTWSGGVPAIYGNGTLWKSDNFVAGNYGGLHLAGTYTTLKAARILALTTSTYTLTSTATGLNRGRTLALTTSTYTLTGTATGLNRGRTLSLTTSAYTLTRNAANLNRGRTLALTTSTYTLTGTATGLNRGRTLTLTTSTYTLTGTATGLNRGRTLSLTTSAYTLTRNAANLYRGRTLALTTSGYTLTRNAANLLHANKLVLDTRTYSLTLNTASFVSAGRFGVITYSLSVSANPVLFKRTVVATTSSYTLTTNSVNFNKGRTLSLATQSYTLTGNTLVPLRSIKLLADTRSYSLTHNDVGIKRTVILSLTVSNYSLAVNTANLRLGATLIANNSTFSITGNSLNLNKGRTLSLVTQSYTLTRNTANLLRGALLTINTRSYSLTRNDATLLRSVKLVADTRSYVFTGKDVAFVRGKALPISTQSYSVTGNSAELLHNNNLPITTESYTLVPNSANLIHSSKIVINSSAYYLTGNNISFTRTEILEELPQDFYVTGNSANLLHSAKITANTSSYSYSGSSIAIVKSIPFAIDSASYNISTFSLNIVKASTIELNAQNYEITSSELNILVGRKILAEGARTNYILNSTMTGASAGSPGTFPTTWAPYSPAWATTQITSIGVDSTTGFSYIDVAISGTNNSGSTQGIQLDPISYNTTLANAGETWTSSAYFGLISGNWPLSSVSLGTTVRNSLGQNIDTVYSTIKSITSSELQRIVATNEITNSAARYIQTVIRFDILDGDSLNLTIRIAAPQLERSLFATNFIPTINAPAYKWFETSYGQATLLAARVLSNPTRYYDTNTYVEPGYFEPNYSANSIAFIRARNFVINTGIYVFTGNESIIGLEGLIKVWTGSSWTYRPIKVWNGTTWVQKPLKIWDGSIWRVY